MSELLMKVNEEVKKVKEVYIMKKFIDILKEIEQTSGAIKAAESKENELIENCMKIDNLKERHEAKKNAENDMIKASEEKKDLQITLKILKSNARIALFNEVIPVALEVLKKYAGKPYGEKTKEKISDEIKEKTNCRFDIASRWDSYSFDIYPMDGFGNDYNITCGSKYTNGERKPLLIDNKIQLITFDEIELYYISREYVEDIPQRIENLKTAYAEAVIKQEELQTACDNFNMLAVGDISCIYSDKHIYHNMDI